MPGARNGKECLRAERRAILVGGALAGKRKASREKREVSLLHQCTWG